MLKILRCEANLQLTIQPMGPILIKEGVNERSSNEVLKAELLGRFGMQAWNDMPHMTFVRTMRNGRYEPYLPGSSLKGVLRAHAERIARTFVYDETTERLGACDPLEVPGVGEPLRPVTSCGAKLVRRRDGPTALGRAEGLDGAATYRAACPICKLFGCTLLKGRLHVSDAFSDYTGGSRYRGGSAVRLAVRDGVGIDRFTGGAKDGAKFDFEVEESKPFSLTLHLENFELWQLGLLAFVLRDMAEGLVPIGFGKSRGLGRVTATVTGAALSYLGAQPLAPGTVAGVGALCSDGGYGFRSDDSVSFAPCPVAHRDPYGIRHTMTFPAADLGLTSVPPAPLWTQVAAKWTMFIREQWEPHERMKLSHLNATATADAGARGE